MLETDKHLVENSSSAKRNQNMVDLQVQIFNRALRKGVTDGLLVKMLSLAVFSGLFFFNLSLTFISKPQDELFIGAAISIAIVISLLCLASARTIAGVSLAISFFQFFLFCWWSTAEVYELGTTEVRLFYLLFIIICASFLPSFKSFQDKVHVIIVIFALTLIVMSQGLMLLHLLVVFAAGLSLRNSIYNGIHALATVGTLTILRIRDKLDREILERLILEGLSAIFRVNKIIFISDADDSSIISLKPNQLKSKNDNLLGNISRDLMQIEGEAGIIRLDKLSQASSSIINEIFGWQVNQLVFYTMPAFAENKSYRLFFPVTFSFIIPSKEQIFRLFLLFSSTISEQLIKYKERSVSLAHLGQADQRRDYYRVTTAEIAHLVNNLAQQYGNINSMISREELAGDLYTLAADLSDFQLVDNLEQLFRSNSSNSINLKTFQRSITRYAENVARNANITVKSNIANLNSDLFILTDTALLQLYCRCLIRKMVVGNDLVSLVINSSITDDFYCMELSLDQNPLHGNTKVRQRMYGLNDFLSSFNQQFLEKFEVNGNSFDLASFGSKKVKLNLKYSQQSSTQIQQRINGWVLLLDDNEATLNIYEKILAVLDIQYYAAKSVAQGLELIKQYGIPKLVVSDWNLQDGTLLDLVISYTENFPPLVVISGEDVDLKQLDRVAISEVTFIKKPAPQYDVVAAINRHISSIKSEGEKNE